MTGGWWPATTGPQSDLPVLLFVGKRQSGPSRRMESLVASVKVNRRARLRVVEVDGDHRIDVVRRFGIREFPSLVLIEQRGVCRAARGPRHRERDRPAPPDAPPGLNGRRGGGRTALGVAKRELVGRSPGASCATGDGGGWRSLSDHGLPIRHPPGCSRGSVSRAGARVRSRGGSNPSLARRGCDRRLRVRGVRRRVSLLARSRRRHDHDPRPVARADAPRCTGRGRPPAPRRRQARAGAAPLPLRDARTGGVLAPWFYAPESGPRRLLWFAATTGVAGALAIRAFMTGAS